MVDLNTASEVLETTLLLSEFQTVVAEQQKARSAKWVLVVGVCSKGRSQMIMLIRCVVLVSPQWRRCTWLKDKTEKTTLRQCQYQYYYNNNLSTDPILSMVIVHTDSNCLIDDKNTNKVHDSALYCGRGFECPMCAVCLSDTPRPA